MKKKLFICHASEDKDDFVQPLAEALLKDFDVWYDDYQLVMGCSLLEEISKGLADCDFGVVVLSKHFFAKNWPQQELNGLFALEKRDKKVILPIWKDISKEDIIKHLPILADRLAIRSEEGIDKIINEIKRSVEFFEHGKSVGKPTSGFRKLQSSLEKKAEEERSDGIIGSSAGVAIARATAKQTIDILVDQVSSLADHSSIPRGHIDMQKNNLNEYHIDVRIGKIHLDVYYNNMCVDSAKDAGLEVAIVHVDCNSFGRVLSSSVYEKENYFLYIDISDNRLWKSESGQLLVPEQLVDRLLEKLSARIENK